MDSQPPQPTISEELLNQEVSLSLMRREWVILHNIVISGKYDLGDARIINPIVDKIRALAAVDSNIPPKVRVK